MDDGSTDGSGVILDEYAAKDMRFQVIHQQNAGVSAARNAALDRAKGEWLSFLDGDDVLFPNALSRYAKTVASSPMVDAFFLPDTVRYENGMMQECQGSGTVVVLNSQPQVGTDLWAMKGINGRPMLRILRMSKFRTSYFPVGVNMMEDKLNLIDVLAVPACWAIADIRAYGYRNREGSAMHCTSDARCEEVVGTFYRMVTESRRKLNCGKVEVRRFWDECAGELCWYLERALQSSDVFLSGRVAHKYFLIESASRMNVADPLLRLKCFILCRTGGRMLSPCLDVLRRIWLRVKRLTPAARSSDMRGRFLRMLADSSGGRSNEGGEE